VLLRLGGDPAAHAAIVGELRREAGARSGSAVVVSAAGDDLFTTADRWGSVGDAEPLMRAVKARFDPHHILNAGLTPWD
jgi:FAD/FMN-containing dehydrogenase